MQPHNEDGVRNHYDPREEARLAEYMRLLNRPAQLPSMLTGEHFAHIDLGGAWFNGTLMLAPQVSVELGAEKFAHGFRADTVGQVLMPDGPLVGRTYPPVH